MQQLLQFHATKQSKNKGGQRMKDISLVEEKKDEALCELLKRLKKEATREPINTLAVESLSVAIKNLRS